MPVLYSGTFYPAYQSQMYLYQGGIFLNALLVAYKFGVRCGGDLSPREGILLYKLHAQSHDGKVLFTINKVPRPEYRDYIRKIILMTKDGSTAVLADVDFSGRYSLITPPEGYSKPSIWDNESKEGMGWFALSNMRQIEIKRGDYLSVNGKDLLDSMSGNAYMVYVNL